ncbi:MAG: hypothetical protein Q8K55_06820, partial [Gemmatimonadaceae bacterium]|nr:hypothetical protein [Gemmatimonadaceae bacterium]
LLVLAVLGRPMEMEGLLAVVGGDSRRVEEHVETLERGGFLVRQGTLLTVAHDEIADAAMHAAPADERRTVNAEIARVQLARPADELALRRAAEHAAAAADESLVTQAWLHFLILRRRQGDRRGTARVAADLFGCEVTSDRVRTMVSVAPLRKRRRSRWMAAAGVLLVAASMTVTAMMRRPTPPLTADFAFWTVDSATGRGRLVGVRISPDAAWEAGAPLEATDLDATAFPTAPPGSKLALQRSPNAMEWWSSVVDTVLGDESVFIDSLGVRHRPLSSPYDDAVETFSPDGRLFAGVTARFDTTTDHLSVVIGDPRESRVTRLTASAEYDRSPLWRPDGTQIAFLRHYYSVRSPDRVCLIDIDGTHERCLDAVVAETESIMGWLDERRILILSRTFDLSALDVVTGARTPVEHIRGRILSTDGALRICECSVAQDATPSIYVFPATDPTAARPIRYRGKPLRGTARVIAPVFPSGRWLETLHLRMPGQELALGHTHHLRVEGFRKDGAPAWLHDLRWTSRDSMVATVDSLGRLMPRRVGETWVVVSAGGWRTDSTLVRIVATTASDLYVERWDSGWQQRWRPFGIPPATVIGTDRGRALLPNGDGSYGSGAYNLTPIAAAGGIGAEALVSLRVTGTQWQTLSIDFVDATLLQTVRSWDHRTGDGATTAMSLCSVGFPGAEGASFRDNFSLNGRNGTRVLPSTPTLFDGSWHRVRLQYFPDGGCALAIDGVPLAVIRSSLPPSGRMIIVVTGHDRLGGRLVVGPMEVWRGVHTGIPWDRLDDRGELPH